MANKAAFAIYRRVNRMRLAVEFAPNGVLGKMRICVLLIVLLCPVTCLSVVGEGMGETSDESVTLVFEDNLIDGKFSAFAKAPRRLSRQARIELAPSRTISSSYYERLIEVRDRWQLHPAGQHSIL